MWLRKCAPWVSQSSSRDFGRALLNSLAKSDVRMGLHEHIRDLGLDAYTGRRPRKRIALRQRHKAARRAGRVSYLRMHKAPGRQLFLGGVYRQSMNGVQQFGLSPTAVRTLRRQAARACSTLGHGRCLTSLLALEMGEQDPAKKSSGTFSSSGLTFGFTLRRHSANECAVLGSWRSLALHQLPDDSAGTESKAPCQQPLRRCASSNGIRRDLCFGLLWMGLSFHSWLMVRPQIPDLALGDFSGNRPAVVGAGSEARTGNGFTARRRLARHQIASRLAQEAWPAQGGKISGCLFILTQNIFFFFPTRVSYRVESNP